MKRLNNGGKFCEIAGVLSIVLEMAMIDDLKRQLRVMVGLTHQHYVVQPWSSNLNPRSLYIIASYLKKLTA